MSYREIVEQWWADPLYTTGNYKDLLKQYVPMLGANYICLSGNYMTLDIAEAICKESFVTAVNTPIKSLRMMDGIHRAFDYLLVCLADKKPINKNMVKRVHELLMFNLYTDFEFSRNEYPGILRNNPAYKPFPYNGPGIDLRYLQDNFEIICNTGKSLEIDPIDDAVQLYTSILTSLPFAKGNELLALVMANYYLLVHNYPPFVLFNDHKLEYKKLINAEHFNHNDFIEFFKHMTSLTWVREPFYNAEAVSRLKRYYYPAFENISDDVIWASAGHLVIKGIV